MKFSSLKQIAKEIPFSISFSEMFGMIWILIVNWIQMRIVLKIGLFRFFGFHAVFVALVEGETRELMVVIVFLG